MFLNNSYIDEIYNSLKTNLVKIAKSDDFDKLENTRQAISLCLTAADQLDSLGLVNESKYLTIGLSKQAWEVPSVEVPSEAEMIHNLKEYGTIMKMPHVEFSVPEHLHVEVKHEHAEADDIDVDTDVEKENSEESDSEESDSEESNSKESEDQKELDESLEVTEDDLK